MTLTLTKENFISMIPVLHQILQDTPEVRVESDIITTHKEAMEAYKNGDVISMPDSVDSAEDFLDFVKENA